MKQNKMKNESEQEYLHKTRNSSQCWETDVGQGCIVVNLTTKENIKQRKMRGKHLHGASDYNNVTSSRVVVTNNTKRATIITRSS
jgi:hypothetical protein